jgi:hypothetical protein
MCSCSGNCNCNSSTIPRGPQGIPGPQGLQGLPGADGQDGQDGTPATVTLGTVNTGAAGSNVIITNTGPNASDAVFNFTIPRGDTGNTGATGATGDGIVLIKSITNTLAPSNQLNAGFNAPFTLTNSSDLFKSNDLCPKNGDVGRITYEVVAVKADDELSSLLNISMDVYLTVSGNPTIVQLDPFLDSPSGGQKNKLNQFIWNTPGTSVQYLYIKYVIDVQRITNTTANIFIDWTVSSANAKNSGCYHNSTTLTGYDFDNTSQFLEFAIKGYNNASTIAGDVTFFKSRYYVESLRLPQP